MDTVMAVEVGSFNHWIVGSKKKPTVSEYFFQITVIAMIMGTVMAEREKEGVRSCRC